MFAWQAKGTAGVSSQLSLGNHAEPPVEVFRTFMLWSVLFQSLKD
jgi:hypothetical protein